MEFLLCPQISRMAEANPRGWEYLIPRGIERLRRMQFRFRARLLLPEHVHWPSVRNHYVPNRKDLDPGV
jgi:hypothetical protein